MTSGFYKYANIVTSGTNYSKRMERLSARIFGEYARPVAQPSLKVIQILSAKPHEKNLEVTNYYPRHKDIDILMEKLRFHGLYRDEHQDFQEEMDRLRALRGKVRPKKHPKKEVKASE